uniref:Uncharacterized protein n=1 Tax=Oryza barthii TaxID=65489 RepID=A0A0D3EV15_9ORYZ
MPAQKRPLQPADSDDSDGHVPVGRAASSRGGGGGVSHESDGEDAARRAREPPRDQRDGDPDEGDGGGGDGSGGGSDSESSLNGAGDKDENNECPACRTHCASRRSLRDDPNYDALIAALYPDIDKYEEEELAFSEEERSRNKKIQATIEETIRRQSEAVGKKRSTAKATATVFARKYRRNMRTRGRGKTIAPDIAPTGSDNEDREEGNAIDTTKESSSADDRSSDLMPKRGRKRPASRASPARTIGSSDHGFEENDELIGGKESFTTSPLRGEMLAWGKNGTRSQTRHGSVGGSNGRTAKGGRVAKLVDHLRTTDDMDKEFNLYLVLLPLDEQSMPNLEKPYISCRPTLSIRHLVQLSRQVEELDIFMRIDHCNGSVTTQDCTTGVAKMRLSDGLERIREDKLLSELHPSFTSHHGDLVSSNIRMNSASTCFFFVYSCTSDVLCVSIQLLGIAVCFENSRLDQNFLTPHSSLSLQRYIWPFGLSLVKGCI